VRCARCGTEWGIGDWPFCPHGAVIPQNARKVHPKETSTVWRDPKTHKPYYMMRNDLPMPQRYKERGFYVDELDSLPKLDKFCKENNVINEKAHFDSNGKGVDVAE